MYRKRFLFRELAIVVVTCVFVIVSSPVYSKSKAEEIDTFMQSKPLFNGVILVSEKGRVIFNKGYGYANFEWKIPNSPKTKFKIGSITKQFTAMLILQLAEAGKIALNDTISDYLPNYRRDTGKQITIHHLLTHTSGLPELHREDYPEFETSLRHNHFSLNESIEKFRSSDLEFEPGSAYLYSNSGYCILGAIIEKVTGHTYEKVLKDKILTPVKMFDSGVDHYQTVLPERANGYFRKDGVVKNAASMDLSVVHAAGSMYSTVEDLYLWDQALYTDSLVSDEFKELMFTAHLSNYGYGWKISTKHYGSPLLKNEFYARVAEHSGRINSFNGLLMRFIEGNHLIVILSNIHKGADNSIAYELAKMLHNK